MGTLFLFIGLERYFSAVTRQRYNIIFISLLTVAHAYFIYVQPSLGARNIIFSLGLLFLCIQSAWLVLRRAEPAFRQAGRSLGLIFAIYAAISLVRVFVDLAVPLENNLFKSGQYDITVILVYQMLFIGLTFALTLLLNNRLVTSLEKDILQRQAIEKEKDFLARFPFENPNPTLRLSGEGTILYANPASYEILTDWKSQVGGPAPEFWHKTVNEVLSLGRTKTVDIRLNEHDYSFFTVPVHGENYVNLVWAGYHRTEAGGRNVGRERAPLSLSL